MSNEPDYIERALIELKRRYGKDELVATLIKQSSEKDIEIGQLKAEIDHLTFELKIDEEQKEVNRLAKIEARKDELYRLQLEENRRLRERVKSLTNQCNNLISKQIQQ